MNWLIRPYVGVGNLSFGMRPTDVEALLGPPRKSKPREMWTHFEFRALKDPIIAYDDLGMGEIGFDRHFGPGLTFNGHDIFTGDPKQFLKLVLAADDGLVESLGTIVSRKLGLSFGGFRADDEEENRSLSVFRKGVWTDEMLIPGAPVRFP